MKVSSSSSPQLKVLPPGHVHPQSEQDSLPSFYQGQKPRHSIIEGWEEESSKGRDLNPGFRGRNAGSSQERVGIVLLTWK